MIPQPSPSRETYRYKESKNQSPMLETELSDAKRAVRDLALKIEEANLRTKGQPRTPKWCDQEKSPEPSVKTDEDIRFAEVMKELEQIKQELSKLKLDMARVLKEKRHAERASKALNSKSAALSASVGLIKKEMQELNEEQAIVEFARIEAVKECELIEARRKEDTDRYKTRLSDVKKNEETTRELQITLSDINLLEGELNMANEMEARSRKQEGSLLYSITVELEAAKKELAAIKGEGFTFMTSMDVIRDELNHVREEKARLQKAEQKRDLTVQSLNSKILRAKAKLEALTASETKSNTVVSNLSIALEQLRSESETAKKEKDVIDEEIENMKREIHKTDSEIQLAEERLEAAMEDLKAIKSSESKALRNLKNVINTTIEARDMASMNSSTIRITNFEYEYLTGKAGGAADLADMKISAAKAWVEALKANEKEIVMKTELTQRKLSEEDEEGGNGTNPEELRAKNVEKVVASPRKSVYRVGNSVKRGRLQKLRSSTGSRPTSMSGSLRREKAKKSISNKNIEVIE